ncbi:MAG: DUF3991 domain-containing protein [Roseburia faecis]
MVVDDRGNPVGYSQDERDEALTVSLCAVASSLGYNPVRSGGHYSLKEMDSVIIYNDKTWNRWSGKGNITGGTQLDFLMAFGGIDTPQQAIKWLLDFKGSPAELNYVSHNPIIPDENLEHRDMVLPPKNDNFKRLFAYLIQTRGLSSDVVADFVHRKLIYEDSVHHNIVYCGYDPEGKIRYAGMRGTADLYGKKFKMDVPGNDKNYGVNIVRKESVDLKVFESVIDCMSYIDMYKDHTSNMLILGMVDDHPLARFLQDYKHIKRVSFCLDNDKAGQGAIYDGKALASGEYRPGLKEKYEKLGYEVNVEIPPAGKDFNEALLIKKGKIKDGGSLGKQSMDSRENFTANKDNKTYVDEFYEKMLNMCGYTRQRILPGEEMATVKFTNSAGRKYLSDGYGDCAQWLKDDPDLTTDQKKAVDQLDKNTRKIHLLKKNGQITGFYIGDNSNEKFTLVEKNQFKYTEKNMYQLYYNFDGVLTAREMDNLKTLCTLINSQNAQLFDSMKKDQQQEPVVSEVSINSKPEEKSVEKNKGNESIKVSIDIPEEFVKDFNTNRFQEFFERVLSDMNGQGLCGKYERETAEMFCQAFANASAIQSNTEDLEKMQQPVATYRRGGHR